MTDQYLCRGKRLDNGAWETGYSVVLRADCHDESWFIADKMTAYLTPVDPSTVGRCTGLRDINGKLIFEGDILRITTVDQGDKRIVNVRFGEYRDTNYTSDGFIGWYIAVEVISNIHDNPELLKGGQDD